MKRIIALLLTLLVSVSLYAEKMGVFNFRGSASFGMINGSVSEKLYYTPEKTDRKLYSQLDWDISAVPVINAGMDFYFVKFLYLGLEGNYAFPKESGYMQDYDYLNTRINGSTNLTHYSKHTNNLNELYGGEAALGLNIPLNILNITPFASVEYSRFKFTSKNGYYQYSQKNSSDIYNSWDPNLPQIQINSGDIISYEQDSVLLKFGLKSEISFIPHVLINLKADISPLSYIASTDNHILKETQYKDFISNDFSWEIKIGLMYNFLKFNNIGIVCSYQAYSDGYGRTYSKKEYQKQWSFNDKYESGIKKSFWTLSFIYEISF